MAETAKIKEIIPVESDYEMLTSPDYEQTKQLQQYKADAERNLMAMSRTARGVIDTSASAEKAQSMTGVSGEAAADLAKQNFDTAIEIALENRDHQFESPTELRAFVEALAEQVNSGIVKDGNLIRSSDSQKYPYVRIANLENEMNKFYDGLYERLNDPDHDPVEAAAYAEFGIDFAGHFFADGCGKTAKVVSSYVLMRSGHELPEYKGGREAYYANQLKQIAGEDEQADAEGYQKFLNYYRGLFED
jgi:hypothetical protein